MPLLKGRTLTGKNIEIEDTVRGQPYKCRYCEAIVFRATSRKGNPFFRCIAGVEHTHPVCISLVGQKNVHTVTGMDLDKFFSLLDDDEPEPETGPTAPKTHLNGPEGPVPPPQIDEHDYTIEPFRTMAQLWDEGCTYDWDKDTPIGNGLVAKDRFIFYRWFYLLPNLIPGRYVIQAKPERPIEGGSRIIFHCSWRVGKTWHNVPLNVKFPNKKLWLYYNL